MLKQEKILKEIEQKAEENGWPIIGSDKGRILAEAVMEKRPKKVIEVGTLVGYSAILMSQYLPRGGKITCLEIDPYFAKLARKNILAAGVAHKVEVKIGDALKNIPKLTGIFDMIFLDAVKEDYLRYLQLTEPMLSPQAVVVADNVKIFAEQMADFLDYVRKSGNYQSETYDFGFDAVEVSKKVSSDN